MVDTARLKGTIAEHNDSQSKLARAIGLTPQTFYKRMKKGVFGSDEIEIMIERYEIEDPMPIFFKPK